MLAIIDDNFFQASGISAFILPVLILFTNKEGEL